jgi:hypothetical protein
MSEIKVALIYLALMDSLLYQITRFPHSLDEPVTVVAVTSKQSAQRLIAGLTEQGKLDRAEYRVTRFSHPEFAFMDR